MHTILIVGVVAVILLGAIGFLFWNNFLNKKTPIHANNAQSYSIGTQTYNLTGTVTDKSGSLVDAGKFLYVNNMLISTSNYGSFIPKDVPSFSVDTSSIKKGNKVEVRYVRDSEGGYSLNCSSCYIKKINLQSTINQQKQSNIDQQIQKNQDQQRQSEAENFSKGISD